jgi:hypothetical protein
MENTILCGSQTAQSGECARKAVRSSRLWTQSPYFGRVLLKIGARVGRADCLGSLAANFLKASKITGAQLPMRY